MHCQNVELGKEEIWPGNMLCFILQSFIRRKYFINEVQGREIAKYAKDNYSRQ